MATPLREPLMAVIWYQPSASGASSVRKVPEAAMALPSYCQFHVTAACAWKPANSDAASAARAQDCMKVMSLLPKFVGRRAARGGAIVQPRTHARPAVEQLPGAFVSQRNGGTFSGGVLPL